MNLIKHTKLTAALATATLMAVGNLYGAAKPAPTATAAPADIPAEKEGSTSKSFIAETDLRAGLMLTPSVPISGINDIVGTSLASFYLFSWLDVPKAWLAPIGGQIIYATGLRLSTGLRFGFSSYSSSDLDADSIDDSRRNDSASVTTIPIIVPVRAGYPLKIKGYGITPYGVLGTGLTLSSMSIESGGKEVSSSSSVDGTFLFGLGAEVNVTPQIAAYLELDYLLAAQEVSGSFLQIHMGASYAFGR